jgi:transcription termination/antitermination protein NusA
MITQPDGSDEVRRLFSDHTPELANGIVEIKAIARERGRRSMLVVYSRDASVDPVGSCLGPRGARVKSVVQQLSGEHIDIIRWSESVEELIRNTITPVVIDSIALDESGHHATVIVDPKRSDGYALDPIRLRLASRVTGWDLQIVEI